MMPDGGNLEMLRPCGRWETFSTARNHLGYYNNVGLIATYTSSPQSSDSLEAEIYAALRVVIDKHSILGAIPLNEDKSYPKVYFSRLRSVDLQSCVEFRQRKIPGPQDGEVDQELDDLVAGQHNRAFKHDARTKPFWRLAVLTSVHNPATFTAAFVFHHALADGSSALRFHDTFLAALNTLGRNRCSDPVVPSPSTPIPPPFEELHPMTVSWSYFLKAILTTLLPSVFAARPAKIWTGNDIPATTPSPPIFKFRTITLSADTTKRLAILCRQNGTSVTAALQCLLAASLFANLPASEFRRLKITGAMSMRRFLHGLVEDQMTNAIMPYEFMHERSIHETDKHIGGILQYFSWSQAQDVKATISTELAKAGNDNSISLLKYVSDMHGLFTATLGKPRTCSADISSIGVYKPKDDGAGKWKIGRMVFSQCATWTGAPLGLSIITGGDGNASLNFVWCEGGIEDELVVRVVEGVRNAVGELVKDRDGKDSIE
ncbi:alcohol acetyltransferase [Paraphoma chrysanthemicola]|uniref:Alcohol acetyltransferase n=1 Tax=Paraphoma chrysanthemicola TaxID=798071 RepID=A0A8K0QYI5_9PLEO|nr:alcohol acetyltransferase [Paraphoma chrysanthemicola]